MPKRYSKQSLEIRSMKHLAYRLGVSEEELKAVAAYIKNQYICWEEPKKNGKMRQITAPKPRLKKIQSGIHRLLGEIKISEIAHCGIKGRSPITNAKQHAGQKYLFSLDFSNFFPNISHHRVYHLFRVVLGCSPAVASLLTRLSTFCDGVPQGGSMSGGVANLVCRDLDKRLQGLSSKFNVSYTRYCDDLCFSGTYLPEYFINKVKEIIAEHGFALNPEKENIQGQHESKTVTGLLVNHKQVRVPRKKKRELRREKYIFDKYESAALTPAMRETRKQKLQGKEAYFEYVKKSCG